MSPYTFVTRYFGAARGGIGRYEENVYPRLTVELDVQRLSIQPLPIPKSLRALGSVSGVDLRGVAVNNPCWIQPRPRGVVHLSNQTIALGLPFLRKTSTVVTVHDIAPYVEGIMENPSTRVSFSLDWQLYRLNLFLAARADRIIVDSQHTEGELVHHLGIEREKISVVPLGVDTDVYRPLPVTEAFYRRYGLSSDTRYLLYVGSQSARKNLRTLVCAVDHLRNKFPTLSLLVVGAPRIAGESESLVNESDQGAGSSIRCLGMIPEADLVQLYNLAEALAYPSLHEGFGLPILEAMACGCPVVCARATSLPEVAGYAGILVEPLDVQAWVEALGRVLDHQRLQRRLREAGFARAREFTWQRTARSTVGVYRSLT